MKIIDENEKKQLLEHFPEEYHELLKKQILIIESTIDKNIERYKYSADFRSAIDVVLVDILNGKYLGINPI